MSTDAEIKQIKNTLNDVKNHFKLKTAHSNATTLVASNSQKKYNRPSYGHFNNMRHMSMKDAAPTPKDRNGTLNTNNSFNKTFDIHM